MTVMTVSTNVSSEVEARRKRAAEALASGKYRVQRVEKGRWTVTNGDGVTYTVAVVDGKPVCDCPDFTNRGAEIGTCKHIEMVRQIVRSRNEQPASAKVNGASRPAAKASSPQPAPQAPQAQPADSTEEDPGEMVVPWGKHKGRKLAELATEAPGFLAWLAFKMEVRTDRDRTLQEAARKVHDRIKASKGQGRSGKAGKADPVASFIAQAGLEVLREVFQAQAKGRSLEDPAVRQALELRLQAIRLVAGLLREI